MRGSDGAVAYPVFTRVALLVTVVSLLAGCATFSKDGGFDEVATLAKERLGKELRWPRAPAERAALDQQVAALLASPLTVDDAVQIALLNNRGLQAAIFELGISEADLVQAGRLPNPGFSIGRFRRGDELEIERGIHFNLARLLALPLLAEVEGRRFVATQRVVAGEVLSLAAQTRRAYYQALAAAETVRYARQVREAAHAGAELARRMAQAGNWNKLQQAREHGFYADAQLSLARAEQAYGGAREHLTRLLGLWGSQTEFLLPERLPDLPKEALGIPMIEQQAMRERLDLQAARHATQQLAANLGLTRSTRFINVFELGLERNSSNEKPVERGYEIRFELPLFDWGGARVAKAEAIYMQAVNRAYEMAVNARSEVRAAYLGYRSAYDIARHYRDEIVPAKKRISDENLLRYNGMLIGVFDLLADARAQIVSVSGYIDALRDFWLAQADLDAALIGKSGMSSTPRATVLSAPDAAASH
jgi:outer membrane protein TolC